MNGPGLLQAPQDRFSVFWGAAGKGGCGRGPQDSTHRTDADRGCRILQPTTAGERGAGLCRAGALPGQEGEK
ncbi:MAG: hypothetical protein WBQ14_06930 [Gaiellaceae bacterium]